MTLVPGAPLPLNGRGSWGKLLIILWDSASSFQNEEVGLLIAGHVCESLLFQSVRGLRRYVHVLQLSCPVYEEGTTPERKALKCSRIWVGQ